AIGLLPTFAQMGWAAPIILLVLRAIQGLALGGEYGGAATYVAEHAPPNRRGYYTSFIQTTATLGLFVSLLVILAYRSLLGEADFAVWGWRLPFLLSIVLVLLSYLVRRKMNESPEFAELKAQGKTSTNPLRESFVNPENRKWVLIALFGATAGQGVVWYTGQFYALYFLQTVMNVEAKAANIIIACALLVGTPFFIFFGALSDRIGRKRLMMAACLLAAGLYIPIYATMQKQVDLSGRQATVAAPEIKITSSTDPVTKAVTQTTVSTIRYEDGTVVNNKTPLKKDGTPDKTKTEIHPNMTTSFILSLLVLLQVLLVTMVYGPIAAFLVELFPTHIRYTSMSLPYHIGNGVFGGLTPLIGTWLVTKTGNSLAGLAWPITIALVTFGVGWSFLTDDMSIKE
ncbi:MAG: MFS transporter, partial [Chthonomonas sp.]|nr:MFS transporter [Chthonomonas sp.]